MTRDEFMKELAYLLQDIQDEDKDDAVQYYTDYFEEAGPDKEAEVIQELGSPERIAAMIRADHAPISGDSPAADGTGLKLRPGPLSQEGGLQRRIKGQDGLPEVAAVSTCPAFAEHIALALQGQAPVFLVIVGAPLCYQGADRPFFLACQFTGQAVTSRQPGPA